MEKSLDDWAADLRHAHMLERYTQAKVDEARLAHTNASQRSLWIGQSIMRIASGRAPLPEPAPEESIFG